MTDQEIDLVIVRGPDKVEVLSEGEVVYLVREPESVKSSVLLATYLWGFLDMAKPEDVFGYAKEDLP